MAAGCCNNSRDVAVVPSRMPFYGLTQGHEGHRRCCQHISTVFANIAEA